MIQTKALVIVSLVALATAAHAEMSPAAFNQFPAQPVYTGKHVRPNVATGFAHDFRTWITKASKDKPNFAGQYVITEWGCGTRCERGAVVNLKTGQATPLPGPTLFNSNAASQPNAGEFRFYEYKLNSRLLVVNTNKDYDDPKVHTYCYELRDNRGHDSLVEIDCPRK